MSAVAETTIQGAVNWFSAQRGYLSSSRMRANAAAFALIPTVERSGAARLNEGRRVAYELDCANRRRVCAVNLSSAAQAEA
jgi:cold shock CspA family protein